MEAGVRLSDDVRLEGGMVDAWEGAECELAAVMMCESDAYVRRARVQAE